MLNPRTFPPIGARNKSGHQLLQQKIQVVMILAPVDPRKNIRNVVEKVWLRLVLINHFYAIGSV